MCVVTYNGDLYIFGGYNAHLDRHFNDLWKFSPGNSSNWGGKHVKFFKLLHFWCCSFLCWACVGFLLLGHRSDDGLTSPEDMPQCWFTLTHFSPPSCKKLCRQSSCIASQWLLADLCSNLRVWNSLFFFVRKTQLKCRLINLWRFFRLRQILKDDSRVSSYVFFFFPEETSVVFILVKNCSLDRGSSPREMRLCQSTPLITFLKDGNESLECLSSLKHCHIYDDWSRDQQKSVPAASRLPFLAFEIKGIKGNP